MDGANNNNNNTKKIINVHPDLFLSTAPSTNKTPRKRASSNQPTRIKREKKETNETLKKKNILKIIQKQQYDNYKKLFRNDKNRGSGSSSGGGDIQQHQHNNNLQDSIQYLQELAKNEPPMAHPPIHTNTMKNYLNRPVSGGGGGSGNKYEIEEVSLTLPEDFLYGNNNNTSSNNASSSSTTPQYGCLKGGKLPTFRNWKTKTQRHLPSVANTNTNAGYGYTKYQYQPPPQTPPPQHQQPRTQQSLYQLQLPQPQQQSLYQPQLPQTHPQYPQHKMILPSSPLLYNNNNNSPNRDRDTTQSITPYNNINSPNTTTKTSSLLSAMLKDKYNANKKNHQLLCKKQKKTIRRTFRVGKHKNKNNVSVLVSNSTTRNNTQHNIQTLKQTPIQDVQRYLVKHGFIKVGCSGNTPQNMLRKMYEEAHLFCGKIENHNAENMLYNFMNERSDDHH